MAICERIIFFLFLVQTGLYSTMIIIASLRIDAVVLLGRDAWSA
jgi:hypothetical protein